MQGDKVVGTILKKYSSFYYVQDENNQVYECRLRGRIKTLATSGDRVEITLIRPGAGVLERILPRKNQLYRPRIANVGLMIIVFACDKPSPNILLLDRLLLLTYSVPLKCCIVLNKGDLEPSKSASQIKDYYGANGFELIITSGLTGAGIGELSQLMKGQISVFTGPSGVGKSTLINKLIPDRKEKLKTQAISEKIGRGRHTTRHVELFSLPNGGWVADTPGFSNLDLPKMKSKDLSGLYRDFEYYRQECQFADCCHDKEKNCSVKEAVTEGKIAYFRYENYLSLLNELRESEKY
ncbi:MAG: ribosome small subunit-dependent GTPase A [Syntrophomonadaceae bacterium]|jgi:ribosome biogenesis GTPase|nr:ribosome small subunit-dependent GTPase A [Syntrophomonadaceae bacterium]